MKDKVLQLIENNIVGAENDLRRFRVGLAYLGEDPGETGKIFEDMIVGYEQALKEAHDMKAWLEGVVG